MFIAVTGKKKKPNGKVDPSARANAPRQANRLDELKRAIDLKEAANVTESDFLKALAGLSEAASQGAGNRSARAADVKPAVALTDEEREAKRRELEARRAARQAAQAAAQARLYEDEEGCVGGSMAHEHTEGESRAEHSRHMDAARQRETDESRAESDALDLAHMNTRKLRQAIVAAEVLGKPVALRSRGAASR